MSLRNHVFISLLFALLFSGCVSHYQDVRGDNYATLQLVAQNAKESDYFFAELSDYSKACQGMTSLGHLVTDTQTSSRVVKIAAEKPLQVHVRYTLESYGEISFILTPQKGKHYKVAYDEDEKRYHVYTEQADKLEDIPESRLRLFHVRECM